MVPSGLSVEEWRALERTNPDGKYEYIDGQVYLMPRGSLAHARIGSNAVRALEYELLIISVGTRFIASTCSCCARRFGGVPAIMRVPTGAFPLFYRNRMTCDIHSSCGVLLLTTSEPRPSTTASSTNPQTGPGTDVLSVSHLRL